MNDETLLDMCQRHVREAEERVAKQERLIAELNRDNHPSLLPLAREVLTSLQHGLSLVQRHLATLLERSEPNGPGNLLARYDAPIRRDPIADLDAEKP